MFGDAVAHARKPFIFQPSIFRGELLVSGRVNERKAILEIHPFSTEPWWCEGEFRCDCLSRCLFHRINIAAALRWPVGRLDVICLKRYLPLYTGLTISKEIKGVIDGLIHLNAEDSRKDPMQETYVSSVRELMRKCERQDSTAWLRSAR